MIDIVVDRRELKDTISRVLRFVGTSGTRAAPAALPSSVATPGADVPA
jgi:hypothetical protein